MDPEEPTQPKRRTSRPFRTIMILALAIIALAIIAARNKHFKLNDWLQSPQSSQKPQIQVNREVIQEQSAVISVVKASSPSVVAISGIRTTPRVQFFGPFQFGNPGSSQQPEEQSIGTGFVLSKDGLIVTNKHVVSGTDVKYVVVTNDDVKHDVKQIYRDPENDLAIVKIDANGLTPLTLGDSGQLQPGQFVIAIGNALGEFKNTVTTGVVSGLGRAVTAGDPFGGFQERLDNLIQTDAAINPGNSGGPLLDIVGNVIGVNVATSASAQNIGFAIPINTVKESVDRFNNGGKFSRAYLGVQHRQIDKRTAILNNLPAGALVIEVVKDSPADKAGIKPDDIITKVAGVSVTTENGGLAAIVAKHKVGEKITITVFRNDKEQDLSVTLTEAPNQ